MTSRSHDAQLEPIVTMMKDADDSDMELERVNSKDSNNSNNNNNNNNNNVEEQMIPDKRIGGAATQRSAAKKTGNANTSMLARGRMKRRKEETKVALGIKYGALVLLVAQMVGLVLLLRYSRTRHDGDPEGHMYLASTAVFVMELMKLAICLGIVSHQSGPKTISELNKHILHSPTEMAKLCVPSFLYTVQNNLLYFALTNLDAATYQVCYQLKILTTAVFSAILLKKKFSRTKWFALIILTTGVAIVQISGGSGANPLENEGQNRSLGLIAVLCAACTSGFSGVYFESILKKEGATTSLWIRNIQMGLPSVVIAFITIYAKDSSVISKDGFFVGYSPIVWTVITVQAVGGIIVALVVKYADNVLKVFATSFSIVISCVISAAFFEFHASFSFVVGASLVVLASVMYSKPDRRRRRPRKPILPKP